MGLAEANGGAALPLTPEHRMLLRIRDTLYEGSWEDFVRDLKARLDGEPYVFQTIPTSPQMKSTIANHLALIDQMERWERISGRRLRPEDDQV